MRGILLAAITPFLLLGCATGASKVAQPASDSAAGIVVKIPNVCVPLMPCASKTLTFARLKDDGGIASSEIYRTSIVKDDHYYLLNAKPGKYVAVAATYARGLSTSGNLGGGVTVTAGRIFGENVLFSEELVRQTLTEVKPGALAVMGECDLDIEGRMAFAPSAAQFLQQADAVQIHYAKQLDPEMESRGATSAIKFYRGRFKSTKRDPATKEKLLEAARAHIGAEGWDRQINRR